MATRRRLGRRILTKKAIEFEGIEEIAKNAQKLMRASGYGHGDIAVEYKHALMTAALIVRDEARDLVPVDTGLLRDSIFAAYGDSKKADVLIGVSTTKAVRTTKAGETRTYAGVIEYGNDEHPPQPFMRPAIQATRPLVARARKDALLRAVEKIAGSVIASQVATSAQASIPVRQPRKPLERDSRGRYKKST
jgi:HK97 gp10 family phage protein